MTYSIKEVAEMFDLSVYTLRYYDKQGLMPFVVKNSSGYRTFTESDLSLILTICCLKNTGMSIKDIRTYIDYCMAGPQTAAQRRTLMENHRKKVEEELTKLQENLVEIDHKLAIYTDPDAEQILQKMRDYTAKEKAVLGF
ncbi:hypothetical protein A5886_002894 [Enterococcus sp. 8G7_MSG3316]|uniref:HTH merR-type domain-containing protein n=1 Tax=Candidatus Enterococcus testudinis TaxID=1834191 RepID=A0A242AB07_9ENTE|nr:MerR family transcriptional regulator [Enterococcus sp. 8G7_MSG3316]OTN77793.1 hypothetical protein A5886_002894 [Enterococcus sp. 8G7_MSG3316]